MFTCWKFLFGFGSVGSGGGGEGEETLLWSGEGPWNGIPNKLIFKILL